MTNFCLDDFDWGEGRRLCHWGGGGAAGAGGSGSAPGQATVFLPPNQGAAAQNFQDLVGSLIGPASNAGIGTPAGQNYPTAQNFVSQYLTNTPNALSYALGESEAARGYGIDTLFPMGTSNAAALSGAAGGALPYGSQILGNAFDPGYGAAVTATQNNPYYQTALTGATNAAGMGATGAGELSRAGSDILTTGFDPQAALFNRTQNQLLDQSNAVNAMSGLAGTPYGASSTANALGNFDTNWQNNLLNRQTAAAGAASPLLQAAPALGAQTAALPSNVYTGNIGQQLAALGARNQAGAQGASGFSALDNAALSGLTGAQNLGGQSASQLTALGAGPYQTGVGAASNTLQGLGSLTNLGNMQYQLPQQVLGDLAQYMGLGQSASQLSGQLGNLGVNQFANTIGGLGSLAGGANSLFGGGSSGGGLGGIGGLIGSPASSWATDAAGAAVPLGSELATDAGGSAASGLFNLLPAAASA